MLDSLITSKTRIKLILKFFLNPETRAYLRGLSEEFGEFPGGTMIEYPGYDPYDATSKPRSRNGFVYVEIASTGQTGWIRRFSVASRYD